jgi:hypothetical protein
MRKDCLRFTKDADEDALAADGWRWRSGLFLTGLCITTPLTFFRTRLSTPFLTPFLWLTACVATGGILALDQHSAHYLRRKTVATLLNVVAHLLNTSTVCVQMFTSLSIDSLFEEHGSWGINATLAPNITTTIQMDRCVMVLRNLSVCPVLVALWMPSSRAGRMIGVGIQAVRLKSARKEGQNECWRCLRVTEATCMRCH